MALEVLVAGFPPFLKKKWYRTAAPIATMKNARMLMTTAKMPSPTRAEPSPGRFAVAGLLAAQTDDNGQGDDAQNVVDDGCTQNGVSGTGVQRPSSFRVSTVMLTEVAVRTTPMKIFCQNRDAISGS